MNLQAESKALSFQLGELFLEKAAIPHIMATNSHIVSYLRSAASRSNALTDGQYQEVFQFLKGIQASDPLLSFVYVVSADGSFYIGHEGSVSKENYVMKDRPWYAGASAAKDIYYSDPYVDAQTGDLIISIMKALREGDHLLGFVAIDLKLTSIPTIMASYKPQEGGYDFLLSKDGTVMYHPDSSQIMKMNINKNEWMPGLGDKIHQHTSGVMSTNDKSGKLYAAYAPVLNTGWTVGIAVPQSVALADVTSFTKNTVIYLIIALLVLTTIISVLLRYLLLPLRRMNVVIAEFSSGNLKPRFEVKGKDEIAQVSEHLNIMLDTFSSFLSQVRLTAAHMEESSDRLTGVTQRSLEASSQIHGSITEVAQSSEYQRESSEQTSVAMEEMANGVQRLAEASGTVSEEAQQSVDRLHSGQLVVQDVVQHMSTVQASVEETAKEMQKLSEYSSSISEIVTFISNIANQTTLLSLNASIEAARVGEQGRGFAVVAGEVKKLAEQSHNSSLLITEKIKNMLETTQSAVHMMKQSVEGVLRGREMVDDVGNVFHRMQETFVKITDQINDISAVAEQMAAGTQEVSASMSSATVSYLATARQSHTIKEASEGQNASIRHISESADDLNRMAAELNTSLSRFEG
nr:methyl-accepting chemotaxis protein [Paenibacillus sp. SYP-B3998]